MGVWETVRRFLRRKPPPEPVTFFADENGIRAYVGVRETNSVAWKDLRQVIAYKIDVFGYDIIAIRFVTSESGSCVEAREEDGGYKQVVKLMETHLPGILEDWWSKVAFPAFATNWTVIWTAGAPASQVQPRSDQ
jgi:hypothetical protein